MFEFMTTVAAIVVSAAIIWSAVVARRWVAARRKPKWSVVIPRR